MHGLSDKETLRCAMLRRRRGLCPTARLRASARAWDALRPFVRWAERLAFFAPMGAELALVWPIEARRGAHRLPPHLLVQQAAPRCSPEEQARLFWPARPTAKTRGVLLVPGVAFDRFGGRLGRGQGYMDRLLPHLPPHWYAIGLAFACQLVARVPTEPHDARIDGVLGEHGLTLAPRARAKRLLWGPD